MFLELNLSKDKLTTTYLILSNNVLIVRLIGQTSGQSPRQIIWVST